MTNKRFKKPFNELTASGQKKRLAIYEKERAELGVTNTLVRAVKPAVIQDIAGGARQARIRLAEWNPETNETRFFTGFAYIKQGAQAYEDFLASIEKGQLLSIDYKESNGYTNLYNIFDRSEADKARRAKAQK